MGEMVRCELEIIAFVRQSLRTVHLGISRGNQDAGWKLTTAALPMKTSIGVSKALMAVTPTRQDCVDDRSITTSSTSIPGAASSSALRASSSLSISH
jgi:hypothetical protein